MRDNIVAPNRRFHVAEEDGALAGFISMRDDDHISQFFVAAPFQGQGVGRRLWAATLALAEGANRTRPFTVDSSLAAIPVYERFGFQVLGPQQTLDGLVFVPMERPALLAQGAARHA